MKARIIKGLSHSYISLLERSLKTVGVRQLKNCVICWERIWKLCIGLSDCDVDLYLCQVHYY